MVITEHYKYERTERQGVINSLGSGTPIAKFYWNRSHSSGPEIHTIYSNAVLEITNAVTGRLVTRFPARPAQLTRYVEMGMVNELNDKTRRMRKWLVPQSTLNLARRNQKNGLNLI